METVPWGLRYEGLWLLSSQLFSFWNIYFASTVLSSSFKANFALRPYPRSASSFLHSIKNSNKIPRFAFLRHDMRVKLSNVQSAVLFTEKHISFLSFINLVDVSSLVDPSLHFADVSHGLLYTCIEKAMRQQIYDG